MDTRLETEISQLLDELAATQEALLPVLEEKQRLLSGPDLTGLPAIEAREQELLDRLRACERRRAVILNRAGENGLPDRDLQSLAAALPSKACKGLQKRITHAAHQTRLLQHRSWVNWLVARRTLVHLADLRELIEGRGVPRPTYAPDESASRNGALLDRQG
jgi:flagellar biosynthesis/type III secretory pathway chaperone